MSLAAGGYLTPKRPQQQQQDDQPQTLQSQLSTGAQPQAVQQQTTALQNLFAGNDAAAHAQSIQAPPPGPNANKGIGTPGASRPSEQQAAQAPVEPVAQNDQGLQESARQGPEGFINIGRYRAANAGSGQQMASALASKVGTEGQAAQNAVYNEQQRVTSSVNEDQRGINQGDAYHGDMGLSGAVGAQAAQAAQDAQALGTDSGRMTALRDMYGQGTGYYGNTSAGLDSFLSGAEGHSDLAAAQQEFGGLENTFNIANQQTQEAIQARQGRDTQRAADWQKGEDARVQKAKDDKAAKDAQDAADAKFNADHKKPENFLDYENNNRAETTVRDVGEMFDPAAWILKATGNQTLEQKLNSGMDSQYGLNSNKVRWSQAAPGLHESDYQDVYDSMTPAELKHLEDMPATQQGAWIMQRLKDIQDKKVKAR